MRIILAALLVVMAGACGDDASASDAGPIDARVPGGTFSFNWTISDGANPLACEDVGGLTVQITARPKDSLSGSTESFTCTSGSGTSMDLSPGTYDIEIDLRASANQTLIAAPISVPNVELVLSQNTPLDAVEFTVTPMGSFNFTLDTSATGTNCGNGMMDADIESVTFNLSRAGTCVVTTFDIAGGSPATYTTTCPTPTAYAGGCIENNQAITVASSPSGTLNLSMTANKTGGIECWRRLTQFTVPGNNLNADLMDEALALDFTPQCDPNAPDAGP